MDKTERTLETLALAEFNAELNVAKRDAYKLYITRTKSLKAMRGELEKEKDEMIHAEDIKTVKNITFNWERN